MLDLPALRQDFQLLVVDADLGMTRCQGVDDVHILLRTRAEEADGDAEAVRQGELLLHGIAVVDVVRVEAGLILEGFPHQVAAVRGGVDQHVFRLRFQAALDDGLQVLVLQLRFLEGEIVHVNDEAVVPVLDLVDDPGEILELVLVDLDHPEAPGVVHVQDRLDAGGFSGAGVAVQEHVVRLTAFDKGLGVLDQRFLLPFAADQIVQGHVRGVGDGDQEFGPLILFLFRAYAEGLVQAEFAHAVARIEIRHHPEHLFHVRRLLNGFGELLHFFADVLVVDVLLLRQGPEILNHGEAVQAEPAFQTGEIIVEEILEDLQVALYELVHAPFARAGLFGDQGEGRFCHGQQKGEIVVPQIFVEAVHGGDVQETVDLMQDLTAQDLRLFAAFVEAAADAGQTVQDRVLANI